MYDFSRDKSVGMEHPLDHRIREYLILPKKGQLIFVPLWVPCPSYPHQHLSDQWIFIRAVSKSYHYLHFPDFWTVEQLLKCLFGIYMCGFLCEMSIHISYSFLFWVIWLFLLKQFFFIFCALILYHLKVFQVCSPDLLLFLPFSKVSWRIDIFNFNIVEYITFFSFMLAFFDVLFKKCFIFCHKDNLLHNLLEILKFCLSNLSLIHLELIFVYAKWEEPNFTFVYLDIQ